MNAVNLFNKTMCAYSFIHIFLSFFCPHSFCFLSHTYSNVHSLWQDNLSVPYIRTTKSQILKKWLCFHSDTLLVFDIELQQFISAEIVKKVMEKVYGKILKKILSYFLVMYKAKLIHVSIFLP